VSETKTVELLWPGVGKSKHESLGHKVKTVQKGQVFAVDECDVEKLLAVGCVKATDEARAEWKRRQEYVPPTPQEELETRVKDLEQENDGLRQKLAVIENSTAKEQVVKKLKTELGKAEKRIADLERELSKKGR
jgi:predicted RNase H-like nuclease (RuvC/YqgF family)